MTLLRSLAVALSLCACRDSQQLSAGEVTTTPELATAAKPSAPLTDPDAKAAADEIAAGHPWLATQRLAPLLRGAKSNSAEVRLVAARAAAAWDGWSEVERILGAQPWLGTRFGGEGLELLTRSALARSADTLAVSRATAAVTAAPAGHTRAIRLVMLARALDRRESRDSARATYERAAAQLPDARDWLLLRAAGVQMDSAARSRLYAAVRLPAARPRIAFTEAQALERFGNAAAAARKYASLGNTVASIRLRAMAVRGDSGDVALLRRELLSWMEAHPQGATDLRSAIDVLDKYFAPLSASEDIIVARAALGAGLPARAVTGFSHAPTLSQSDRLSYGQALAKVGRHHDAIAQFDSVTDANALGARAAYQRARSQLALGDAAGTRATLKAASEKWASLGESDAAIFLLADLTTDDGDEAAARALFHSLAQRYPNSPRAPEAGFRSALLGYITQPTRAVAAEFDSVAQRYAKSDEHDAAVYWSGRALAAAGDSSGARSRWERIVTEDPASYYALVSAARLGRPWAPPADSATGVGSPLQSAAQRAFVHRVALLDTLGMDAEQRVEFDALEESAGSTATTMLPAASALAEAGQASRASRLAIRAIEKGDRSRAAYQLAYPLVHGETLTSLATKRALDPWLVAAIIRQESSFNPRAISAAGARGLMQVMPEVGRQLGTALGFPVWDNALLLEPDANLQMGTEHLASFLRQFDDLPRALAAYNAGQARVQRWAKKAGSADAELFAESIPFEETRGYVRVVQRNRAMYAGLYGK